MSIAGYGLKLWGYLMRAEESVVAYDRWRRRLLSFPCLSVLTVSARSTWWRLASRMVGRICWSGRCLLRLGLWEAYCFLTFWCDVFLSSPGLVFRPAALALVTIKDGARSRAWQRFTGKGERPLYSSHVLGLGW